MGINIGDLGEDTFQRWCTIAGLNAHKAQRDKYGWDYLVEIPVDRNLGTARDLHKGNGSIKVQVKSSEAKAYSTQVEISNLLSMATNPLPSFYLFYQFDTKISSEPTAAFIVSIDQHWIDKILKRVRELTLADPNVRLNKKKMAVTYSMDESVLPVTPPTLFRKIREYVNNDFAAFTEQKQSYLAKAGIGGAEVSITLDTEEEQEKFFMSTLGYPESVNVSLIRAWEMRYGLKDTVPLIDHAGGKIEITVQENKTANIMFSGTDLAPITFAVKFYFSPLSPDAYSKPFRMKGEFFDVLMDMGTNTLKISPSFDPDKPYPLVDFENAVKLLNHIYSTTGPVSISLEIDGDYKPWCSLNCSHAEALFAPDIQAITCFKKILSISGGDLRAMITRRWLLNFNDSLNHAITLLDDEAFVRAKGKNSAGMEDGTQGKLVFLIPFKYSSGYSLLFFSAPGITTVNEDSFEFLGKPVTLDYGVSGPTSKSWLRSTVEAQREKYQNEEGIELLLDHLPKIDL